MGKKAVRETDLYPPLKSWLEKNGYTVHSEVLGCDIAARRGDELALIEIKLSINLDLLLQIVRRQEADAAVYAAVPAPKVIDKRWRALTRLLKRLEAGLLLVYLASAWPRVEVAFHPIEQKRVKRKAATNALLSELSGRSLDMNCGGSTRTALVTAYRERALRTAAALAASGPSSPAVLRRAGAPEQAGSILYQNHYDWFARIDKGVYSLTEKGRAALLEYRPLVEKFALPAAPMAPGRNVGA